MGYFNYLQNFTYTDPDTGDVIIVKNILTRGKILEIIREQGSASLEYTIEDEERPETLAHRIYGRSDYHWLVLLYNEILDPYFQWPLSINEMEKHMESVYSGQALFIDAISLFDENKKQPFDRKELHFSKGDLVEQRNRAGEIVASGTVREWNPNLYKLVVEDVSGIFSGNTLPVSDRTSLMRNLYTVNKNGKLITSILMRVTNDNRYSLHHFEDGNGEYISPLYRKKELKDGGVVLESPATVLDRYVFGGVERNIELGIDESRESLGVANIVTNIEYEERKNETKRKIKLMRPEYIDPVLRDFRRLFSPQS